MKIIASALFALLIPFAAWSQPVTLATAKQGSSTHAMGLAIAKAASEITGLDVRPSPYKSTSQASPIINDGDISFGLENAVGLDQAMNGTGRFTDNKMANLRLVSRLLPLRFTLGVRKNSDIKTVADLAGKRLPSGFGTTVTGELLISTMLGTGGVTYDDVEKIQVASFSAMAQAFVDGDLDAYIFIPGSPRDAKISLQVDGVRGLDLPNDAAGQAFLSEVMPVGKLFDLDPAADIQDLDETTTILQYDYFIYTNANESAEAVTNLLKSLHDGKSIMTEMAANLKWFETDLMYLDIGLAYHPAALEFFEDNQIHPY